MSIDNGNINDIIKSVYSATPEDHIIPERDAF